MVKKTAQKIILELKDKFEKRDFLQSIDSQVTVEEIEGVIGVGGKSEAIEAPYGAGVYEKAKRRGPWGRYIMKIWTRRSFSKAALKQIVKI